MNQGALFEEPKRSVVIRVNGKPEPKGSFRAVMVEGRPTPIPDNSKSKTWERAVKLAAARVCSKHDYLPFDRPCAVEITFHLRRPLKPKFRRPATKPDYDKLVRSTGDALSGIAYLDDARVVEAHIYLQYTDGGEGADIVVEEVTE